MNTANNFQTSDTAASAQCYPRPQLDRQQMRQAVVDVLWAQAHVLDRIFGRTNTGASGSTVQVPNPFQLMVDKRSVNLEGVVDLGSPADAYGIHWDDVAATALAQTLEELYDFAYFATFDSRYYPGELGDETGAWWVAMYLKDCAASQSLSFQADYSGGSELASAQSLLQIVETANARHLLEGADETFVQDSGVGYLTIRQLALVSDFKEESLRVLANPKRKNALPTQSVSGSTMIAAQDAREWLKSKGRYMPISPKQMANRPLDLKTARFDTTARLGEALADLVSAHATRGVAAHEFFSALRGIYPAALWKREGANEQMFEAELTLSAEDFKDETRLRDLARVLELDADLLVLKAREAALRESLTAVEAQLRAKTQA